MADNTTVETWKKSEQTKEKMEQERAARLAAGAISSTISEDASNWILTSVWKVIGKKSE